MLGHYLMFNRNCEEALHLYEKAFDTKAGEVMKYKNMPQNPDFPIAENDKELVLHAKMVIDGTGIMCADSSQKPTSSNNMYITLTTSNEEMVRKAWDTLKEGGKIFMELSPTFFGKLHGQVQDKFGINWMFTVE
ncbi:VOC family protein [Anaerocolumna chitinilytica]|uniref:VOC family protein n=1 Tax=Anaerocolumna chitinilytica TaxID=1727145 RepID=A0A7I8DPG9_9FIRM|nr:VOC family protein [Anaerocolumna chitinilytica]BCJ99141.1 VOC family protein [Anaerocolumna chitinilytica]